MFVTPYFGGCKYTNNFLFINKIPVFQHFALLITSGLLLAATDRKASGSVHFLATAINIMYFLVRMILYDQTCNAWIRIAKSR